jgi:DNA-binding NarL/FixJ family response regulator
VADVLFVGSDLMFSSQLMGAAAKLGLKLLLAASSADAAAKLTSDCRLVLVDLTLPGLDLPAIVAAVRGQAPAARIVAFGPHVDEVALAAAQKAGADVVLSRGQFHREYAQLLAQAANSSA